MIFTKPLNLKYLSTPLCDAIGIANSFDAKREYHYNVTFVWVAVWKAEADLIWIKRNEEQSQVITNDENHQL